MVSPLAPIIEDLLVREGGVVTLPDGPNGASQETRWGQTPEWLRAHNLPKPNGRADAALHYEAWLRQTRLADLMPLPDALSHLLCDFAVHHGERRAIMALQRILGVKQSGIIGAITIGATLEFLQRERFAKALFKARCHALADALKDRSRWPFARSWFNRIGDLTEYL